MMGTSASLFNVRASRGDRRATSDSDIHIVCSQQIFDRAHNVLESFGSDGAGLVYALQRQLQDVRKLVLDCRATLDVCPNRVYDEHSNRAQGSRGAKVVE